MAKASKTPLQQKYDQLPRSINFQNDVLPTLAKAGISQRTFYRDMETDPGTIPSGRLMIYAQMFNCDVEELINSYGRTKSVKSLVKSKLGKKVGLITILVLLLVSSCSQHYCPTYGKKDRYQHFKH